MSKVKYFNKQSGRKMSELVQLGKSLEVELDPENGGAVQLSSYYNKGLDTAKILMTFEEAKALRDQLVIWFGERKHY